jgi:hypothetical protein
VTKLEVFPSGIERFQAHLLGKPGQNSRVGRESKLWVLCRDFGIKGEEELGDDGQMAVDVKD